MVSAVGIALLQRHSIGREREEKRDGERMNEGGYDDIRYLQAL